MKDVLEDLDVEDLDIESVDDFSTEEDDTGGSIKDKSFKDTDHKKIKKKMPLYAKILIIIAALVLVLVMAVIITWSALKASGRSSLYSRLTGKKPTLTTEDTEVGWEEGWVRYNGKIYEYNDNILTFLVMGTDYDDEITEEGYNGQSDSNFLVVVNPDDKTVKLVCINRDSMVDVDVYNKSGEYMMTVKQQIALQHAYGTDRTVSAERMVTAVSRFLYDLPISGYCAVDMAAIGTINDAVGGVTVECKEDLTALDKSYTQGSIITLHGRDAFEYVRYRDEEEFESNRDRLGRQKEYLKAFLTQAKSSIMNNPTSVVSLYNSLMPQMTTDLSIDEVTYLLSSITDYEFDMDNIRTLEGETLMGEKYEEFYPDTEALKELMIQVFYREVQMK
jgi:LCP family protein required for cell wall assembly